MTYHAVLCPLQMMIVFVLVSAADATRRVPAALETPRVSSPRFGEGWRSETSLAFASQSISSAFAAMASAPSNVLFPPMNPAACTNMPPSTPATSSSAASRTPRHAAGSGFRFSNALGVVGMGLVGYGRVL